MSPSETPVCAPEDESRGLERFLLRLSVPLDATIEERRHQLLNLLLAMTTVVALLTLVMNGAAEIMGRFQDHASLHELYVSALALLLSNVLVFWFSRFSPSLAAWLFVLILLAAIILGDSPQQTVSGRNQIAMAVPVVAASLLISPYTSLVISALISLAIIILALSQGMLVPTPMLMALFLVALFSALLTRLLERSLEHWRAANRNLALLNQASQTFSSSLDLDQVLATVLKEVCHLLGAVAGSVWLSDPDSQGLICRQATGPQSEQVRGWRLTLDEGIAGAVARTGQSLIVPDLRADERHFKELDRQIGLDLRSVLSVPLQTREQMVGVLQVLGNKVGCFDPEDQALLESLGATAAIAIENARLYAEEQERADTLARALAQQRELDRLKSEFIQNVSHELRTPIGIVRGYAELLDGGQLGDLEPGQKEAVSVMVRRIQTLNRLVDDISTILEVESQGVPLAPVDLAEIGRELLEAFQADAERGGLSLEAQFEPGLPPVLGNADHLIRVVDNLLRNAIKFTPGRGRVSLRLWGEGASVVLEVADTGVGIPPDQLERVFDRFYQGDGSTTRRHGGTGLGLALVKEIVQAHGGEVSVTSQLDEGSTVRVTLPAAPADKVRDDGS